MLVGTVACARTPDRAQGTLAGAPIRNPEPSRRDELVPPQAIATRGTAAPASARLGQEFDVRVGEAVAILGEPLTIGFEEVVEDSRCPANTTCIWAGRAVVRIGVRVDNTQTGTLNLETSSDTAGEGEFQKYRLRLVRLAPVPQDGSPIPAARYVATLMARRLE